VAHQGPAKTSPLLGWIDADEREIPMIFFWVVSASLVDYGEQFTPARFIDGLLN
jgi:hypothetical protein